MRQPVRDRTSRITSAGRLSGYRWVQGGREAPRRRGSTVKPWARSRVTATVEFVKNNAVVDTVSGPVTAEAFTKATAIFTDQFDDVRVSLLP